MKIYLLAIRSKKLEEKLLDFVAENNLVLLPVLFENLKAIESWLREQKNLKKKVRYECPICKCTYDVPSCQAHPGVKMKKIVKEG